jgi:hypothetical protein
MVFSLFLRMGHKTKIDVSALPFVLDTIPVIFKSIRIHLQKNNAGITRTMAGRTAILRTRHQEKIPDACAGS